MSSQNPDFSRRRLLQGSSAAVAAAFGGPIAALATRVAEASIAPSCQRLRGN